MNSLPTQDVSAVGLKLDGDVGSSAAELFPINLIAAIFHWDGIYNWAQQ